MQASHASLATPNGTAMRTDLTESY
jgi:hypothetical protein